MNTWFVEFCGGEASLKRAEALLKPPDYQVIWRDNGLYARHVIFDGLPHARAVRDSAIERLEVLNALLSLTDYEPISLGGVIDAAKSPWQIIQFCNTAIQVVFRITSSSSEREAASALNEAESACIMTLAGQDEYILKALHYFNLPHTWANLHNLLDVIEASVGGERALNEKAWISQKERKRFTHTANSPAVLGDAARHGASTTDPPKHPMVLSQAEQLLTTLLVCWLRFSIHHIVESR